MIVFCTKSPNGTITFREPVAADWLGSWARKQWVPPKSDRELKYASIVSDEDEGNEDLVLKKGQEGKLETWHPQMASEHWRIMRTVMPARIWELW